LSYSGCASKTNLIKVRESGLTFEILNETRFDDLNLFRS
ncbi:hypothetical protein T4A_8926, partial [Trichinella pseudospiralis]